MIKVATKDNDYYEEMMIMVMIMTMMMMIMMMMIKTRCYEDKLGEL